MGDEFQARYADRSHRELYEQLNAGDPTQVKNIAAEWKSVADTANGIISSLNRDLGALLQTWEGAAGQEYQQRLSAISSYASMVAGESDGMYRGLDLMADTLREAKSKAEDPAATDDSDKTVAGVAGGAATGMAIAGPAGAVAGGVIGGIFGHDQDKEEQERARQRMVQLVSQVAAQYDMTSVQQWPLSPELGPDGLPWSVSDPGSTPIGTGGGSQASTVSRLGPGSAPTNQTMAVTGAGPTTVTDLSSSLLSDGTLAGAGELAGVGSLAGGASGPANSLVSGNGALLGGAAALTAGGLAASIRGAASNGANGAASMGRPPAGMSDAILGRPEGDRSAAATTNRAQAVAGTQRASAAAPGSGYGEDEVDERTTWLTEDDMDWGGSEGAAPAVLGGGPAGGAGGDGGSVESGVNE